MQYSHELIMPNKDLPFKMFLFEGKDGNYFRDKHWHRSIEIFAVLDGGLVFHIGDRTYPLSRGEFILVNSNEIHSVDSPKPNRTVVLQIPLKTFEEYFTGDQFILFSHDPKDCGYEMKVKSQYYMLLYLLVTKYRELDVSRDAVKRSKKLTKLSAITNYIKENYTEDLSLETLAEIFGYSPAYLSRMFQKYAGINYKSYLQGIRLEYAYRELLETNHTISDTALNNGFPNSKAFSKAFTEKYGRLPSEFRREQKKRF